MPPKSTASIVPHTPISSQHCPNAPHINSQRYSTPHPHNIVKTPHINRQHCSPHPQPALSQCTPPISTVSVVPTPHLQTALSRCSPYQQPALSQCSPMSTASIAPTPTHLQPALSQCPPISTASIVPHPPILSQHCSNLPPYPQPALLQCYLS